jgi:CheY-like chemotaxis protein
VILDLLMPVMTGHELYASMQSDAALAQIPVIVSTSDPARAPSGVVIIEKPIVLQDLLDAVARSCGR